MRLYLASTCQRLRDRQESCRPFEQELRGVLLLKYLSNDIEDIRLTMECMDKDLESIAESVRNA